MITTLRLSLALSLSCVAAFVAEPTPFRLVAAEPARDGFVHIGAGGYLVRPGGKSDPIRSVNLKGAPPTTQWFSSLLFRGKGAHNEFPHPLGVRPTDHGLAIHYPGSSISVPPNQSAIMGILPERTDLVLGSSETNEFADVQLDAASDWFIRVAFTSGGQGMRLAYGHGSPFVYAEFDRGGASLACGGEPKIWAGSEREAVLGLTIGKNHYGLFGPTGSRWEIQGAKLVNRAGDKRYFSLAVLPDATPETLARFRKHAYAFVTDTRVAWSYEAPGLVKTTFTYTTQPREGTETATLFALYPHQWKYTKAPILEDRAYASVRGRMKVGVGKSFTTEVPIQGVLPLLPPQAIQDKARMDGYLKEELAQVRPAGALPTYDDGKLLGKLASLSQIAEAAGDTEAHRQFLGQLRQRLERWLIATPGKAEPLFVYDSNWRTLVGLPAAFGSDWPFNDHHFHYGYFIRAAAEVARCDPSWAARKQWGGMVELLIRDIASPDRADPMFPFLRCFDRYAGHSWASGDAAFADGNNQESSSESMNAWYGLILWGQAIGDTALRDLGLYLYTTEMTAIEEYWFDVANTNFPKEFSREALGMVWGGKGAYGTWFSGDADCIYGINYLPYTPGSIYLVRNPDYIARAYRAILAERKGKDDLNAGWGDLILMFHAGQDPADAAKVLAATPAMKVEPGNSRAFLQHWVDTLNSLGVIDKGVTADYPLYNVYTKAGHRTYVVYNLTDKPLAVKFSDGTRIDCATKGFKSVSKTTHLGS